MYSNFRQKSKFIRIINKVKNTVVNLLKKLDIMINYVLWIAKYQYVLLKIQLVLSGKMLFIRNLYFLVKPL